MQDFTQTDFIKAQLELPENSKSAGSRQGLADAIDSFLCDNEGVGFPPFELCERFGVTDTQLRGIVRKLIGLGTGGTGQKVAASNNAKYVLYLQPYPKEGARNQYVAFKVGIDPRTGKPMKSTKAKTK